MIKRVGFVFEDGSLIKETRVEASSIRKCILKAKKQIKRRKSCKLDFKYEKLTKIYVKEGRI